MKSKVTRRDLPARPAFAGSVLICWIRCTPVHPLLPFPAPALVPREACFGFRLISRPSLPWLLKFLEGIRMDPLTFLFQKGLEPVALTRQATLYYLEKKRKKKKVGPGLRCLAFACDRKSVLRQSSCHGAQSHSPCKQCSPVEM